MMLAGRIQQGAAPPKPASEQTAGGKANAEKGARARRSALFEGCRAVKLRNLCGPMDRRRKNQIFDVVPKLPRAKS